ncbi:MAG: penicillin-binding protein 2 [Candidatus Sulfobium sp.]|jgi:penicillin-binding protein 2
MLTEKKGRDKIATAGYIIVLGFLVIAARLWQLQILQGDEFRKMSESNRMRVIGIPAPRGIIYDRNGIALVKNVPYFSVSVMPADFDRSRIPALSAMIDVPAGEIEKKLSNTGRSPMIPVRLKEGLSFPDVSFIEARRSDFPGLFIDVGESRKYLYGPAGAHLIGYLGKPTPRQAKNPEFSDVPPGAFIGQWGAERLFDKSLRGIAGQRIIEVDALGREIRLLKEVPPVKGQNLVLSIDMAVEEAADKAFKGRAGAFVALKPDTGEVLGMVSSPEFDPNKFVKGISYDDWLALSDNDKKPMLNRALQSQYPPGSTFKIIDAVAGLETHVIDDKTVEDCRGAISVGRWRFRCWKHSGHGHISLHRALVESCDVFFYEVGRLLGIERIHEYAVRFGLGRKTGITIGTEKAGLIPDARWKEEKKKKPWYLGETFVNAIGQGYVLVTPIQQAVMISAVSNGGNVYKPLILKDAKPVLEMKAGVSAPTLETVKEALAGVVNEPHGTAGAARSDVTLIGGKTGTAQVVGIRKSSGNLPEKYRDHAWFVAFAPIIKPEIAASVLVEHGGHGGSAASPIAKAAIEAYMLSPEKKKEFLENAARAAKGEKAVADVQN